MTDRVHTCVTRAPSVAVAMPQVFFPGARLLLHLAPAIATAATVAYMHRLQALRLQGETDMMTSCLLFLPAIGLDLLLHRRYDRAGHSRWGIAWAAAGVLLWTVLFLFWTEYPARSSGDATHTRAMFPVAFHFAGIVFQSRPGLLVIFVPMWILAYYYIVVRHRRLRLTVTLAVPILLGIATLRVFYDDLLGGVSKKQVLSQPGVEIVFPRESLANYDRNATDLEIWRFPRTISMDERRGKVYAGYGSTFFSNIQMPPTLLEYDLHLRAVRYLVTGGQMRDFATRPDEDRIYLTCWGCKDILEVDKREFQVSRRIDIDSGRYADVWEPMGTYYLRETETLFIANSQDPMLIKFDLRKDRVVGVIDLKENGMVDRGGGFWNLQYSYRSKKLYLLPMPARTSVIEIDPVRFEITRHAGLPDWGSALALDDDRGFLYVQEFFGRTIWEMNMDDFTVTGRFRSPLHSRQIAVDGRHDRLYALGWASGNLVAIDRKTGEWVSEIWVGNKPHGLRLTDEHAYVLSTLGLIRLPLP